MTYPIRTPVEELHPEDIAIALNILDQEDAIAADPVPLLYWRRAWKRRKNIKETRPGDLHYYKNCKLLLGVGRYWRKKIESVYLFRRLVTQYICPLCAIKREKENKKVSAYFLRLSADELLWTEREVNEYEEEYDSTENSAKTASPESA